MQIKALIEDEDAVSPVIGVILMVAITVILAAVIGTFVLGLGDQVSNTTPQASLTFDFSADGGTSACSLTQGTSGDDGTLDITHDGGDKMNEDRLSLTDGSATVDNVANCDGIGEDSEVKAGKTMSVNTNSDQSVRVIWTASGGGDSGTIGKWTGPDA